MPSRKKCIPAAEDIDAAAVARAKANAVHRRFMARWQELVTERTTAAREGGTDLSASVAVQLYVLTRAEVERLMDESQSDVDAFWAPGGRSERHALGILRIEHALAQIERSLASGDASKAAQVFLQRWPEGSL